MIFLLSNIVNGNEIYLPTAGECTVGRKNCDILLSDQSISRLHAKIRIKEDGVTLEDCKSTYHTKHNGIKLDPTVVVKLNHLDLIQFGTLDSKFRFESYKFLVTGSVLKPEAKATLKESLAKCHGKFVDKWSSRCTHLVVDQFMLTVKVLLALITEIPIVTHEYFTEYAKTNKAPDINKYNNPPITEQLLKFDFKYKYDSRRRSLFENKVFIFSKANGKKQMEDVIKGCGGTCTSWEEEPKTLEDMDNSPLEHIFIKTEADEENTAFNEMIKNLEKRNKRHIPLNEIALAVVNCSCEINCNPSFNKMAKVFGGRTQKKQTQVVLAGETETQSSQVLAKTVKTEEVIPATLEDDWLEQVKPQPRLEDKEVAGVKRVAEETIHKSSKKPKIQDLTTSEYLSGVEISDDSFITAVSTPVRSTFKEVPRASLKRKASNNADVANIGASPFGTIKIPTHKKPNTSKGINPFATLNSSKLKATANETVRKNPFAAIQRPIKSQLIKTEKDIENNPPIVQPLNRSDRSTISSCTRNNTGYSFANVSWKTKSVTHSQTVIKEEDPELAEISKAFQDCVTVALFEPLIRRRKATCADIGTGKNFKKFKKVQPLHPQNKIINPNQLQVCGP